MTGALRTRAHNPNPKQVLNEKCFFGEEGSRTLFSLSCIGGVDVSRCAIRRLRAWRHDMTGQHSTLLACSPAGRARPGASRIA